MRVVFGILGLGVLVTLGIAALIGLLLLALLIAPALVALSWNVLDFGQAIGLGSLGFWGCVLLGWFLAAPMVIRLIIVLIVFIADPGWLNDTAQIQWPEPTLRNFVAILILLLVASFSHSTPGEKRRGARDRPEPVV